MRLPIILVLLALLSGFSIAGAKPLAEADVPRPLKPWTQWVLHDHPDHDCPQLYNGGARHCVWPSVLSLDLDKGRGGFRQRVTVYRSSFVALPGDARHWPQKVSVDGEPASLVSRDGAPSVYLPRGEHRIAGDFPWSSLPESLTLPADTGLIDLRVNGEERLQPDFRDGRLWLRSRPADQKAAPRDSLKLRVFRRIVDDHPMRVLTRLRIEVSGRQREMRIGKPLLDGFVPLRIHARLPARLEPDGSLRVQVRPGVWLIDVEALHPAWLTELALAAQPAPWPAEEIWSFDARPALRLVEVVGGVQVDPRQTQMPKKWRSLPAYRVRAGERLVLKVIRRGDPAPTSDSLSLQRSLWLDFDGQGYTVRDRIGGAIASGWRLSARPPLQLGRVVLDGRPRFITRLEKGGPEGVEVRKGRLDMLAESRIDAPLRQLPASGWDRVFEQVDATLHLPPGWRLLAVSGVDAEHASWLRQWTLYDLFLVFLIAAAVGRLWNWRWALVALIGLALIWHEPEAPRFIWIFILAMVGLLRVLPAGRYRVVTRAAHLLGLAVLLISALPFVVEQARTALYPQLAPAGGFSPASPQLDAASGQTIASAPREVAEYVGDKVAGLASMAAPAKSSRRKARDQGARVDPNARIQTGPGLPEWHWRSVSLTWNGPVDADQRIGLTLAGPLLNACFNLLRILLVALLAWRMLDRFPPRLARPGKGASGAVVALLAVGVFLSPSGARADYPSPALLKQLETRLTEAPECLPRCADIERLGVELADRDLRLRLRVASIGESAIPLPLDRKQAVPLQVFVDTEAATALRRDPSGQLWLSLPPGPHDVLLRARLARPDRLSVPLPLAPHHIEVIAEGWNVDGLRDGLAPDGQLHFRRATGGSGQDTGGDADQRYAATSLPPFVRIERTLRLGLEWSLNTRVIRVSPSGVPIVLKVPLLAGESVISEDVQVEHGRALVNMGAMVKRFQWRSRLPVGEPIHLEAPRTSKWIEVWKLDVGPQWHADIDGIAPMHHQADGRWLPTWAPWPGESVELRLRRPEGVAGATRTIDHSELQLRPGRRVTDAMLRFRLRSSQGGRHRVGLPEGVELLSVKLDGRSLPLRLEDGKLFLPIHPGVQTFELSWRQPGGMAWHWRSPRVDLGLGSVNANLHLVVPTDRWLLFARGPRLGPAVLFWSLLLVVLLVALVLGRVRGYTPLGGGAWMLLGVGLSQVPVGAALCVVATFFVFGWRGGRFPDQIGRYFNPAQVLLAMSALVTFAILLWAVRQGLLGRPEMQVTGNGSSAFRLNWYQDRAAPLLPLVSAWSAPLLVYRLLMLAWALWLAFSLLGWMKWGWRMFSHGGRWKAFEIRLPGRPAGKPRGARDNRPVWDED